METFGEWSGESAHSRPCVHITYRVVVKKRPQVVLTWRQTSRAPISAPISAPIPESEQESSREESELSSISAPILDFLKLTIGKELLFYDNKMCNIFVTV
jgi:hypothetical protein